MSVRSPWRAQLGGRAYHSPLLFSATFGLSVFAIENVLRCTLGHGRCVARDGDARTGSSRDIVQRSRGKKLAKSLDSGERAYVLLCGQ